MTLVGYWPLNESSGDAEDYSGNGNDGTVNGATQGSAGILGQTAYDFDGTDDYVRYDHNEDVGAEGKDSFSISVWFKPGATGQQIIHDKTEEYSIFFDRNGGQDINFATYGSNIDVGTSGLSTGEWHFVEIVWNIGSWVSAWVNGKQYLSESSYTNTPGRGNGTTYRGTIGAGWDLDSGYQNYFDGSISEVRLYDHALSPLEVQYLYETSLSGALGTEVKRG